MKWKSGLVGGVKTEIVVHLHEGILKSVAASLVPYVSLDLPIALSASAEIRTGSPYQICTGSLR